MSEGEETQNSPKPLSAGCAGVFYPESPGDLSKMLDDMLGRARAPALPGPVMAIMVPHAGYQYSGQVASMAYRLLAEQRHPPEVILIISNCHTAHLTEPSVYAPPFFKTPLGELPVATALASRIQRSVGGGYVPEAHEKEHPLEVQFPFVQKIYPKVPVVSIALGPDSLSHWEEMARRIVDSKLPKNVLFIASTDMSHFPSEKVARQTDQETLKSLESFDPELLSLSIEKNMNRGHADLETTLCGEGALRIVIHAAKILGATGMQILSYDNSASITGDPQRVVGYGAAAVYGPPDAKDSSALNAAEGEELLLWSRKALENLDHSLSPQGAPGIMKRKGVFVTLRQQRELRGCIGWIAEGPPVAESVWSLTRQAALEDSRFSPVSKDEVDSLHIELSFLSELRRVEPHDVIAGLHGVLVRWKGKHAVFLPDVATAQGWDRSTLITRLITEKAGFPKNALEQGAELFAFTAQVFSEQE